MADTRKFDDQYPVPYFAPIDELPEPLPTDAAIRGSKHVLKHGTGRRIVRVGHQIGYIVVEYIQGRPLNDVWEQLSDTEKTSISTRLRGTFETLRSLPSPGYFGCVGRQPLEECVFWTRPDDGNVEPGQINGPFDSEEQVNHAFVLKYLYNNGMPAKAAFYRRALPRVFRNHRPIFTHGDFQRKNVVMQDDGDVVLIDWESAGWYPDYWEYCLAMFACGNWNDDWNEWIAKILDEYPTEISPKTPSAMFLIERLVSIPILASIWRTTLAGCLNFWRRMSGVLGWQPKPPIGAALEDERKPKQPAGPDLNEQKTPSRRPRVVTYHPIPGSWERKLHPEWPEERFQIPDEAPYGTVYYVTRGAFIGVGATARIEKTIEGAVVKSPKRDPYDARRDSENRRKMRIEAEVYRRLGDCPRVPKMLAWDPETCCLTLEYFERRDLALYMRGMEPPDYDENGPPAIDDATRRRWAVQTAQALKALHDANVIHSDFAPRNLLLDAALNVYISDFAGSSVDGAAYMVCGGPRYTAPFWTFSKPPERADDLFSLGSVLYLIMTSTEPFADKDESDVIKLFEAAVFPDTTGVDCGHVIQGCWKGTITTVDAALRLLNAIYTTCADTDREGWVQDQCANAQQRAT
ncbi:phosphotransferase enzyme family protein [Niveomyces insectorum RCEF 264]|uniref:EKC/KEOPS complex subunit BUD32 n=1 Tax=Niveomyces insectorum RCEF 264 TaxID=1081102 RepID=A0A167MWL8_9HYPO|nr:phosphotransferase enzyme family protein [Niveomyces insectorum RCEF 264]